VSCRMWNVLTSWQDAQVGNKLGSYGDNQQNGVHGNRCLLKRCGATACVCVCVCVFSCGVTLVCVCLVFSCGVTLMCVCVCLVFSCVVTLM